MPAVGGYSRLFRTCWGLVSDVFGTCFEDAWLVVRVTRKGGEGRRGGDVEKVVFGRFSLREGVFRCARVFYLCLRLCLNV